MKREKSFELEVTSYEDDTDTAYLMLPKHPGAGSPGVVKRTESLCALVKGYRGPEVNLDFDNNGVLIGIELLEDEIFAS